MPYNLDILDPDNLGLEDLAKMEENFNILNNSRIAEHNLDVSDPSNGYYIRWENGLQICWKTGIKANNVDVSVPSAGGYRSGGNDAGEFIFPASFIDTNYIVYIFPDTYNSDAFGAETAKDSTDYVDVRVWRATQSTIDTDMAALAIGRWK